MARAPSALACGPEEVSCWDHRRASCSGPARTGGTASEEPGAPGGRARSWAESPGTGRASGEASRRGRRCGRAEAPAAEAAAAAASGAAEVGELSEPGPELVAREAAVVVVVGVGDGTLVVGPAAAEGRACRGRAAAFSPGVAWSGWIRAWAVSSWAEAGSTTGAWAEPWEGGRPAWAFGT